MNNILHLTKDCLISDGVSRFLDILISNDKSNRHFIISRKVGSEFEKLGHCYLDEIYNMKFSSFLTNAKLIKRVCKEKNINIIHSHHRYFDLLSYFIKMILKINTIMTVHSKVYGKKYFSYKSDKIIAVSKSLERHLLKYFNVAENNLRVINNFIDPHKILIDRSIKEIKKELNIPDDKYIIGYVGRLDIFEEGIDLLIKAAELLLEQHKDIVFVLVGEGINKNYLIKKIESMSNHFRILKPKNNIFNYMQVFDQMVIPSRIDPFPFVMLEAAYLKIPVVGSKVDGIAEFVEEYKTGLLFESEDYNKLAEKILYVKNNNSKDFVENAYNKVTSYFTKEIKLIEYQKLYNSLADSIEN